MTRKEFLGLCFLFGCNDFEEVNVRQLIPFISTQLSIKLPYLLVGAGGQSPLGTIDQFGQEDYGKQPYSVKPDYLKETLTNVTRSYKSGGGNLGLQAWEDRNNVVWGYYDKVMYMLNKLWPLGIVAAKESTGGTTNDTAANGGGTYPMSNFIARLNQIKTHADTTWGEGNYNKLIFWDIGHTNCVAGAEALAGRLGAADIEKFAQIRAVLGDETIIMVVWIPTTVNVDFPLTISIGQPQQTLAASDNENNFVVKGINARWSDQDIAGGGSIGDDFSHQNVPGDLSKANDCIDKVCEVFSLTIPGSTPVITSAVIASATPTDIVITTDSTTLDTLQSPSFFDFSVKVDGVLSRRIATLITMSSTGFTVRFSESFYVGQDVELTYNQKHVFESCVADINGNELEAFTDYQITNNSSTAAPTVTNLYTMNLASGVDGWAQASANTATLSVVDGYLRVAADATSFTVFKAVTMNTGTFRYRITHKVNPDLLVAGSKSNDYSLNLFFGTLGVAGILYPYFRRDALTGDLQFEFVFTNPNINQIRIALTPVTIGQYVEFKEVTIDRLS